MENNKTNLEIEEQNESVPEDEKLVPQEQHALTVKKQKNIFLFFIIGLILVEGAISGVLWNLSNKNDLNTRVLQEFQIRNLGKVNLKTGVYKGETDFGYFNGNGQFDFNTGSTYKGSWADNEISGVGKLNIPSKGKYTGDFKNSKKNGNGSFTWSDGSIYTGEWKDDMIWGQGEYKGSDDLVYKGYFESNKLKNGSISFSKDKCKYWVNYSNGDISNISIKLADGTRYDGGAKGKYIDGNGKMSFSNGDTYTGNYSAGKRNAQGTYKWANGDSYVGNWKNDKMSGEGTYTFTNGNIVKGMFEENSFKNGKYYVINSFGKYTFTVENSEAKSIEIVLADGTTYSGPVTDGKLSGKAQIKYSNGDTYSGDIYNGTKSGQGTYTWSSGASYDGAWQEDKMNGSGNYYYPSSGTGYKLVGNFKNNKPDGQCEYYESLYTSYNTDWSNGKCVKVYD